MLNLSDLKQKRIDDLLTIAEEYGVEHLHRAKHPEIILGILRKLTKDGEDIRGEGTLEIHEDGFGFLRSPFTSYSAGADDIYVSHTQIRRLGLRTGDSITGKIRAPRNGERYFALMRIDNINQEQVDTKQRRRQILFENLTPLFPTERLTLERGNGSTEDLSGRIVDFIAPIGKGQRGLIVSPPKAGKTLMLQAIAQSITANHPEVTLIVLLIDERPEEVTEMKNLVNAEVVASTFDESHKRHIQVAEMVIEKAKRLVEQKRNVVILLDSITRLARAYNTAMPTTGRVLTGGVDANALERPKRFFGAARNIEEGGSLTIVATALVETGSRMDEVIYEEFKGTGNQELHLERRMAESRVYPAINIRRSGTRREELLLTDADRQRVWILRKLVDEMDDLEALEFVISRLSATRTNEEFFGSMKIN